MKQLNVLRPSIEPRASGHIIEQIELVKTILNAGYAYISNGSVYFDVEKYDRVHTYGVLSGRIIDEMMAGSRELDGQDDKRSPNDFALWKKASPEHIMRWPSPWSVGFPGWHLECSAMSEKYLGEEFDIHGGGMDLIFPHHECELAQNVASRGKGGVNYWVHNNLITINGQKMGKSKGNFITLEELFAGRHEALDQPYSPMTIRFFILQAHYRSTLDFSNEALQAAEKGLKRLMQAAKDVVSLKHSADAPTLKQVASIKEEIYQALLDDINTPVALSSLFEAVKIVNGAKDKGEVLNDADYNTLNRLFTEIVSDVLGLTDDRRDSSAELLIGGLVDMILQTRNAAKAARNWAESDRIRDELKAIGIHIKDTKEGTEWELTN
jgi:cysteinyl-tRNA synthetase